MAIDGFGQPYHGLDRFHCPHLRGPYLHGKQAGDGVCFVLILNYLVEEVQEVSVQLVRRYLELSQHRLISNFLFC